jgi:cell division septum initiation protein DivIVA
MVTHVVTHACRTARLGCKTVYRWREEDLGFAEAWKEALEAAIDDLEESAFAQAKSGKSPALVIYLLKCHRPEGYREAGRGSPPMPPARPAAVKAPTLGEIFGDTDLDLSNLEAWAKMAKALGQYDLRDIAPLLVKISDQQTKIRMINAKGASSEMLAEIRQLAREVFGETDEMAWDGNAGGNADEDDDD